MSNNDTYYYKIILFIYLLGLLSWVGIFYIFLELSWIKDRINEMHALLFNANKIEIHEITE